MKTNNIPCSYPRQLFSTSILNSDENSDEIKGLVEGIIHNAQREVQRQNETTSKRKHDSLLDEAEMSHLYAPNKKATVNGLIDAINQFQRSLVETTKEEITHNHDTASEATVGLVDSDIHKDEAISLEENHKGDFQDPRRLPELKDEDTKDKALLHKHLLSSDFGAQTNDTLIFLGSQLFHYVVSFKLNELYPSLDAGLLDSAVKEVLHLNNIHIWTLRLGFEKLLQSKYPGKQFRPKILAECFIAYVAALDIEIGPDNKLLIQWILNLAAEQISGLRVKDLINRSAKISLHNLKGPMTYKTSSLDSKFSSKCLNSEGKVLGHGSGYTKTDSELRSAMHALSSIYQKDKVYN